MRMDKDIQTFTINKVNLQNEGDEAQMDDDIQNIH